MFRIDRFHFKAKAICEILSALIKAIEVTVEEHIIPGMHIVEVEWPML